MLFRSAVVNEKSGKPRYLGLILTALLIIALLAVAAVASVREEGLAGLFNRLIPSAPEDRKSVV